MARWTIQRRCCSRHPLMGVRVADFPGVVYVFTMTDPRVHDTDPRVHDTDLRVHDTDLRVHDG